MMINLSKLQTSLILTNTHLIKFLCFATWLLILGVFLSSYLQYDITSPTKPSSISKRVILPLKRPDDPPILAYWIYGSHGDSQRIVRLLKAIYHPRNQYLLMLDGSSSWDERAELALSVQSDPLYAAFDNVNVVGKSYAVNRMGGSGLASVLHAAALLLKISTTWDWFITLSAYDYPLFTQDDILHAFTLLPRDLNFVHFTNTSTPKVRERVKQIVVDPSLYDNKASPIFYATDTRDEPNMFNISTGTPWVILSRTFIKFCVNGWDNLPRKLLMYMTNIAHPLELYFQTILCNSPSFQNTTINHDLRYIIDKTTLVLNATDEASLIASPFKQNDGLLTELDKNVLKRSLDGVVPGKWCVGQNTNATGTPGRNCSTWGDINSVEASPRGVKMRVKMSRLVSEKRYPFDVCPKSVSRV